MKKMLYCAIALMIALAIGAVAEGYTFQTIPWGASAQEVKDILLERGLIREEDFDAQAEQLDWLITRGDTKGADVAYIPEPGNDADLWQALVGNTYAQGVGDRAFLHDLSRTIGGYEVREVCFNFLYGVEDGKIIPETHLTLVAISFQDTDGITTDDLTAKLVEQYGEYEEKEIEGDIFRLWYGEDDTLISVFARSENDPSLVYACTGDYEWVRELRALSEVKEDAGL